MLFLLLLEKIDDQIDTLRYTLYSAAQLHDRADDFVPGIIDYGADFVHNRIGGLYYRIGRLHQWNELPVQQQDNNANEHHSDRGYTGPDNNRQVAPPG